MHLADSRIARSGERASSPDYRNGFLQIEPHNLWSSECVDDGKSTDEGATANATPGRLLSNPCHPAQIEFVVRFIDQALCRKLRARRAASKVNPDFARRDGPGANGEPRVIILADDQDAAMIGKKACALLV